MNSEQKRATRLRREFISYYEEVVLYLKRTGNKMALVHLELLRDCAMWGLAWQNPWLSLREILHREEDCPGLRLIRVLKEVAEELEFLREREEKELKEERWGPIPGGDWTT